MDHPNAARVCGKPIRTIQVSCALSLSLVAVAAPQNRPDTAVAARRFGRAQIMGGIARLDVKSLNGAFAAKGYPTLPATVVTYGAGAYLTAGRVLVGGSGHKIISRTETTGGFTTKLTGGYGLLDLGLAVLTSPRTTVFAVGGGGAGRLTSRIQVGGGFSFDSALSNPRRGVELRAHNYLYHVGIGIDQFVVLGSTGPHLNVGLRAGYIGAAGGTKWRTIDADLTGGPDAPFTGAYVRFTVGKGLKHRVDALIPALTPVVPWLLR